MHLLLLLLMTIMGQLGFTQSKEIDSFYQVFYSDKLTVAEINMAIDKLATINTASDEETLVLKSLQADSKVILSTDERNILTNKNLLVPLKSTYQELLVYAEKNRANLGANFLTQLANLRIRLMAYESTNEMIKLSNMAKKEYEIAIKKDSKNFLAYLGLAQWYYFAPKIGGGNLKKSLEYYNQAERISNLDYQKYLVALWSSQVYFKENKTSDYEKTLAKAVAIYPNGEFLKNVKKFNAKGKAF